MEYEMKSGYGPKHEKLGALQNEVRLELAALGENVALARSFAAAFALSGWDLTLPVLEEIKVAVSEATSNAIIHGYGAELEPACEKFVSMRLCRYQRGLLVEIGDSGVGIADIRQAMEPDFTTKPEHLGLGFAFMNTFMDMVRVESAPGAGTKVRLVRLLPEQDIDRDDERDTGSDIESDIEQNFEHFAPADAPYADEKAGAGT